MLKWNWKPEQKASSELELAASEIRIWVALLCAGACRGVKALNTTGAHIMDDLLRGYGEARSWQRLEVILSKFFQHESLTKEWNLC
jgi:hypothetical protein